MSSFVPSHPVRNSYWLYLQNIFRIQLLLTTSISNILVRAIVTYLDCYHNLLTYLPASVLVQNRFVSQFYHIKILCQFMYQLCSKAGSGYPFHWKQKPKSLQCYKGPTRLRPPLFLELLSSRFPLQEIYFSHTGILTIL